MTDPDIYNSCENGIVVQIIMHIFICLFFTALSAYVCFIYLSNISFKDQDFFIISIALFTAVVTFIFLKLYKTQRKNIKQINFSLKAIYIEEKNRHLLS
ncbi:hypothetical protein BGH94_04820 [Snodgrassella alvi]|nr:hypothetical protein BGH94_04820 [Snodgrassella alvi]ORF03542.1 hypothetical protein BGH95_02910 [Snodgrassella alvi]